MSRRKSVACAAEEQPNLIPRVNVGATGFDTVGDSALFDKEPLKLRITAAEGRNLSYLCIIHPWMQGRISVR